MVILMLKRLLSLYIFFIFCFMVLLGRIFYIAKTDYSQVTARQGSRTVTVGEKRGEIFDRNFSPLVGEKTKLLAVVTPCAGSYEYLKGKVDEAYLRVKIENASPFTVEINEEINNEFIRTFSVPQRYTAEQTALHLIGYTDSSGKVGLSGIEKAYNNYLSENSGKLTVTFQVDAIGRVLAGMDKYINDENFTSMAGVVLTIDKTLQKATETALQNSRIKSGCAIVMSAHNGEILAMASVPTYDPKNPAKSLSADNSPFVNKALMSYSVGSIFKPVVAACAMENGISPDTEYECKGKITVSDKVFSCYDDKAHGKINMTKALEVSCNCYFISLMDKIDSDHLLKICRDIGLGQSVTLAPSLKSATGTLPTNESLRLKGALANFLFGQGDLLATPLQIATVYHTLATGNAVTPKVVLGLTNYMGLMTKNPDSPQKKVLSDETVLKLKNMLSSAGKSYNLTDASGKTGTAQSGIYKGGAETLRTWFAGYYPAENPEYIIVVLNENGTSGTADCVPVFREITEAVKR